VKNIFVSSLQWSDYRDQRPDWVRRGQDEIYRLFAAGRLRPHITRRHRLADYAAALAALRSAQVLGKAVCGPTASPCLQARGDGAGTPCDDRCHCKRRSP